MDTPEFWNLVALIDQRLVDASDDQAAVQNLTSALSTLPTDELEAFDEILARKLFALDTQTHADHAGESGASDDGFLYVRCYVVSKGESFYEMIRSSPEKMPHTDEWCEALLYVAQTAWSARTGNEPSAWPFEASVSYESGSNPDGWPTD